MHICNTVDVRIVIRCNRTVNVQHMIINNIMIMGLNYKFIFRVFFIYCHLHMYVYPDVL